MDVRYKGGVTDQAQVRNKGLVWVHLSFLTVKICKICSMSIIEQDLCYRNRLDVLWTRAGAASQCCAGTEGRDTQCRSTFDWVYVGLYAFHKTGF